MFQNLRKKVGQFHEDERGLEALQVVMIIAVAALCLILVKTFWGDQNKGIVKWFTGFMNTVLGWQTDTSTPQN